VGLVFKNIIYGKIYDRISIYLIDIFIVYKINYFIEFVLVIFLARVCFSIGKFRNPPIKTPIARVKIRG